MKGSTAVKFSNRGGADPDSGRLPGTGVREGVGFGSGAWGFTQRALCLCCLLCLTKASLAAANEGIQLRLSDELSQTVRDYALISDEPAAAETGRFLPRFSSLKLGLSVTTLHDDNVLRSNANEESSLVILTAPKVLLAGRLGRHGIVLGYEGKHGNYLELSEQNYFDHEFIAGADLLFSRKLKVALDTGLFYGHDQPGDFTSRLNAPPDPDRWRRYHAGISATFGRAWASVLQTKAGFGIGFQQSGIRYLNNNQGDRDYDRQSFALKGRYNLGPTLSLVADAGLSLTDYTDPATPLDNREVSLLVGIAWAATAKTTGEVKLGLLEKDFDDPNESDFSGANFNFKVEWSPRTFSTFTAYGSRDAPASGQGGGSVVISTAGLRWRHGFSSRLVSETGFQYQQADFESDQQDELYQLDAAVRYRFNRFLDLRAGVGYASQSSNNPSAEYDDTSVLVEMNLSLERRPGRGDSKN